MPDALNTRDRLVTVFGGSGFVGRHIVRSLARRGWRVRVAVRRPDLAAFLQPIGGVGQVQAVQANVRYPESVAAAIEGADAVVNATGVQFPSGRQSYEAVHVEGARAIARAAAAAGVTAFVHVSGIGADPASRSPFIASKGRGEAEIRAALPGAIVLRPSIIFGPEDDFFNRFGALSRYFWVLPLFGGGGTKLQPVFVGDVAEAAANALDGRAEPGATYELGGPDTMTLREAAAFTMRAVDRRRLLIGLPLRLSRLLAGVTELARKLSLGLYPALLTTTRDQVNLLANDNCVGAEAAAAGRTLAGVGIGHPQAVEAIAPSYLVRFRKTGQYGVQRTA